jgi:hypothetical protein
MAPAQQTQSRVVGLTKQKFSYGHLLKTLPRDRDASKPVPTPRPEPKVDDPPIGSSEDELNSPIDGPSEPQEAVEPDILARIGKAEFRVPAFAQPVSSDDDEHPDPTIKPQKFTTRGNGNGRGRYGSSQSSVQEEEQRDEENPFGSLGYSNNSRRRTIPYKRKSSNFVNIHAPGPSPKREKASNKKENFAPSKDKGGFKVPDISAAMAQGMPSQASYLH